MQIQFPMKFQWIGFRKIPNRATVRVVKLIVDWADSYLRLHPTMIPHTREATKIPVVKRMREEWPGMLLRDAVKIFDQAINIIDVENDKVMDSYLSKRN